ncbi:MAG: TIM barrel protein [Opitutales bacterium]
MKPKISLSTCWCSQRHQDGYAMACEMRDLGFDRIELSHGIRLSLVPGILRAVEEEVVKISSVHNFCPLPPGIHHAAPNIFTPSARDMREHQQWLRYTKATIEFTAQLGADRIVVHSGNLSFFWRSPGSRLKAYRKKHPGDAIRIDPEYRNLLEKVEKTLRKRMEPFVEQMVRSISMMLPIAAEHGVKLGLENREGIEELPMDDTFPFVFNLLNDAREVGYWHDSGHAKIKEQMGFLNHEAHLRENIDRLIGFHLHDVSRDGHDHQQLGTGVVDFKMLKSFIRPEHTLVLELSPRLRTAQVLDSKAFLEDLLAE